MSTRWTELDLAEYVRRNPRALRVNPLSPVKESKPLKFRNKKTEVDGIVFDSKREAHRYQDLKIAEKYGVISDLKLQTTYPLIVNGVLIASYRSDFEYMEDGKKVVEDTKSEFTRRLMWYRMKKKLMLALHGIEIRET